MQLEHQPKQDDRPVGDHSRALSRAAMKRRPVHAYRTQMAPPVRGEAGAGAGAGLM